MLDPRSTLLNGNHSFPAFYACYLLRSRAKATSRITYIGSSPDPPRRIRQHNGELTRGARKTSKYRPWEMQMIVYGFPSKLVALQFEYAWQKPEQTRHLRDGPTAQQYEGLAKKDRQRNTPDRKIGVVCALLALPPFSRLPLHVRFFNEATQSTFEACRSRQAQALPHSLTTILDLGGVAGDQGPRIASIPGVTTIDGPIDVEDFHFRDRMWAKFSTLDGTPMCMICETPIDLQNHVSYSLCPSDNDCLAIAHIECLATNFLREESSLLPTHGHCPCCQEEVQWGDIIRSIYARKALNGPPALPRTRRLLREKS